MLFMTIENKGKLLINDIKSSILDVEEILDSPLYKYLK